MSDSDLVVVFDLLDAGFKDWSFSAFGLIFVAVGFLMVRYPRPIMQLFNQTSRPRFYKYFSRFWLGFAILWTALSFAATYGSYLSLRGAYIDGNFEVVEGPVEDFQPMPSSGHSRESFTVAGQGFSYSDYNVTPGFNNSRSLGGPIDAEVYVRISHVNGQIVRLEVERSAAEAATDRSARLNRSSDEKIWNPPEGSLGALMSRNFWIPIILTILATAAVWRWRGKKHIARDPSLRKGYNRMTLGFVLWVSFPVFVVAIASMFGELSVFDIMRVSANWSFWSILNNFVWGFVIAKWLYWTFFQNGAAKMAQHPGLIDHEWVAKLWPSVVAAGYVISIVRSLV